MPHSALLLKDCIERVEWYHPSSTGMVVEPGRST